MQRTLLSCLILLATLWVAVPGVGSPEDEQPPFAMPDTIVGSRAGAFLEAFGAADREKLLAWEREHRAAAADEKRSIEDRVAIEMQLAAMMGTVRPIAVLMQDDENLVITVFSENMQSHVDLSFAVEPEPPHKVISIRMESTGPPELVGRTYEWKELPELAEQVRADGDLPSVAIAIVAGDEIVAQSVVGVRAYGGTELAEIDDLFHIGSITKSITATVIGALVDLDLIDWSTTIGEILPDVAMEPVYEHVTIEQLLRHRGGIEPHLTFDGTEMARLNGLPGSALEQRAAFLTEVLSEPPSSPPGAQMAYSNAGYALLGHLAEVRTGTPWEQLVEQFVFDPASMSSAGIGWPATSDRPDQPRGHYQLGSAVQVQEIGEYELGSFMAPAGDVHCTIGDLARYARMHLRGLQGVDGSISSATIKRLHTPLPGTTGGDRYAGGWVIQEQPESGEVRHWHNGSAGTFYAAVALYPEQGRAIVFATNAGGGTAELLSEKVFEAVLERAAADR